MDLPGLLADRSLAFYEIGRLFRKPVDEGFCDGEPDDAPTDDEVVDEDVRFGETGEHRL